LCVVDCIVCAIVLSNVNKKEIEEESRCFVMLIELEEEDAKETIKSFREGYSRVLFLRVFQGSRRRNANGTNHLQ
jgi:hypothetical protein